jgi:hypothetical protein
MIIEVEPVTQSIKLQKMRISYLWGKKFENKKANTTEKGEVYAATARHIEVHKNCPHRTLQMNQTCYLCIVSLMMY